MLPTLRYSFPADADLAGRRVLVMGLGSFDGGAAVVRFLAGRGARVTATDLHTADELKSTLDGLADVEFERVLGEHRAEDFARAELIVVNPAIPPDAPLLADAARRGVPLASEVGLFFSRLRAPFAWVSGSKGKSTTTTLLFEMARAAGIDAVLGGNIGRSLLNEVDALGPRQLVVFEVSSFQLEQLVGLERSPAVAVLTNLYEVHLNRHGTMDAYAAAKRTALAGARTAVLNWMEPRFREFARGLAAEVVWFSTGERPPSGYRLDREDVIGPDGSRVIARRELRIPGVHNVANFMAAFGAARALGADARSALDAARAFRGVPHRLETVAERDGVRFVNDSIATTPEATLAALAAIDGPLVLIAGGKEATCSVERLASAIAGRVAALVTVGESGPRVARAVREIADRLPLVETSSFESAFAAALARAPAGGTVLLSPAFPSYDLFKNFRERGETFRRLATRSRL